jgi:hypothetical protein
MTFEPQNDIENAKIIIDHFGYWPTFHDSEIISIKLERMLDKSSASIQIRLFAFELTNEIENGVHKLTKHCFINFEFMEVSTTELEGFNHQNAVFALEFGKEDSNSFCNIVNSYGVDGYIEARLIRVNNLEPIDKDNVFNI